MKAPAPEQTSQRNRTSFRFRICRPNRQQPIWLARRKSAEHLRMRSLVLAERFLAPESCSEKPRREKIALPKRESGAPKGALSYQCPHRQTSLRNSSVRGVRTVFQRAHLSALTLAALATGYYPDGSAPEPGFPRRRLTRVLPASLERCRG